jgi:tetratricopeptide (TPR) repeat protein
MTNDYKYQDPIEPERIREITRIILSVLQEYQENQKRPKSRLSEAVDWVCGHWVLVVFAFSILALGAACIKFGVSPWHPIQKIADEKKEYDRKELKRQFTKAVVERNLKMGRELLDEGLYEEARQEFEEALRLDSVNLYAELGIKKCKLLNFVNDRKYDSVVLKKRLEVLDEYCMKLKESNKHDDPHIFLFWGELYWRNRNIDKAIKNFERAINSNPNMAEAYFKLGYLYDQKSDDVSKSLEMYKKAAELSKWNPLYWTNLASQYAKKKDHEKAIPCYLKAIKLAPEFILPYVELSVVFQQNRNFSEALKYQQMAVILLENQQVVKLRNNQYSWEFCSYNGRPLKLYKVPEKQAYAYLSMALTLHLLDKKPEALSYLEKARSLKIRTMSNVKSVVRQDNARLPDQSNKKSDFLAILNREISTSE